MRSASAALAPVLLLAHIRSAAGATESLPGTAHLEVLAPHECTSEADLAAGIARRSPQVRFVERGGAWTIRTQFRTARSGAVTIDLSISGPNAVTTSRRLLARSCADGTDAVALIVAVTLGPALDPSTTEPPRSPPTPAAEPAEPTAAATSAAPGAVRATDHTDHTEPVEHLEPTKAAMTTRIGWGGYLAGHVLVGPAPAPLGGVMGYGLLTLERDGLWSPAIVVGLTHVELAGYEAWGGRASFSVSAASLDACPIRVHLRPFEARACASASFASFSAKGDDTQNPRAPSARPLGTIGLSTVWAVQIYARLAASIRFAAGLNLVRDSFEFGAQTFHTVDPLSLSVSVGLGLHSLGLDGHPR